jgi:hypothetical protein
MADNNLPKNDLPTGEAPEASDASAAERRAFLRRAALVGIPVLIATVPGRVAWAGGGGWPNPPKTTCQGSLTRCSSSASAAGALV